MDKEPVGQPGDVPDNELVAGLPLLLEGDMAVFSTPAFTERLGLLQESTAAAARRMAADAVLLAEMIELVPAPRGTGEGALAWQSFVTEVAGARGVQDGQATTELTHARRLVECHPSTLAMLAAGAVTVGRARALVAELVDVAPEIASQVDEQLAERLPRLPSARIRQDARRAVDRLDADAAAVRAAKETARRGVRKYALRDGQAEVVVTGPAVELTRWWTALDEAARRMRHDGDPRTLNAVRFDLITAGFAPEEPKPGPATESSATPEGPVEPAGETLEQARARVRALFHPAGTSASRRAAAEAAAAERAAAQALAVAQEQAEKGFACAVEHAGADPAVLCDVLAAARAHSEAVLSRARAAAAEVVEAARRQAEITETAADAFEAAAVAAQAAARAELDRLTARLLALRLTQSQDSPTDRRSSRPFQVMVHVLGDTALGLSNEPGWLEGYGWLSAPLIRTLLPEAELRRVCTSATGQVIDQDVRWVRPEATPDGVRDALINMISDPFALGAPAYTIEPDYEPSRSLDDLVRLRDRFCDGPTTSNRPAADADLDHGKPWPTGPTAAWNLAARTRRIHRLKHAGWRPVRTTTGTLWFSPAGQLFDVPHDRLVPSERDPEAGLPDAGALARLDSELCRPFEPSDEPPQLPAPF